MAQWYELVGAAWDLLADISRESAAADGHKLMTG